MKTMNVQYWLLLSPIRQYFDLLISRKSITSKYSFLYRIDLFNIY